MTRTAPIPTGTVTLLFTDVEGSTRLWETEPGAMAAALRRHDDILRTSIESTGGYVFKTVGDAFCAAFPTPQTALRSALSAQEALITEPWPTRRPLRVRMALHTGVCEERDDDYFGPVVNRTARLEAVAHGGQVLVSGATAELLEEAAPGTVVLKDLGLHRLKDLGRAEQVFQVESEQLPSRFPPLRSLDNPELSNNLPSLPSAFIGRERELAEIRRLLSESRLVTLTGAGGSGKTRLALQAAAETLDGAGEGAWLVELATVSDPARVPSAVAAALGVAEAAGQPVAGTLVETLSDQRLLVILDNCEHLVEACARLAETLSRGCPFVRLLATSREPLGVDGERVYRVPSLDLPPLEAETMAELERFDSVRFFLTRARAQDDSLVLDDSTAGLIASICRRLDGIPLALELAAARLSSMSLVHLHERLDQRFRLLTGGSRNALPRQQTLQAMVDWSFSLLSDAEQALLRRLSVFKGGFELEAAEAVGTTADVDAFDVADLLGSLVDKSLVVAERSSGTLRYRLLETMADYAAQEMLRADGEAAVLAARGRHAAFFLELVERAAPELDGPRQGQWLLRLDREWDNLQASFGHLAGEHDAEGVLRFGGALQWFLWSRGHQDVLPYLREAAEHPGGSDARVLARGLVTLATVESQFRGTEAWVGDRAAEVSERAFEACRRTGDPALVAWGLLLRSGVAYVEHDDELAEARATEALDVARSAGDDHLVGHMLRNLAHYKRSVDLERSRAMHAEALACFRRAGDTLFISMQLHDLSGLSFIADDVAEGRRLLEEAAALAAEIGARYFVLMHQSDLSTALLADGELEAADLLIRSCLVTARRQGLRAQLCGLLFGAACCATWRGEGRRAARLHGKADADIESAVELRSFGWTSLEDRLREETRAELARLLPADVREAEYGRGRELSVSDAVDLALGRIAEE